MRVVRAGEVEQAVGEAPPEEQPIHLEWWEGPHDGDHLSAGIVTMAPGASTPPHVHLGGQVMVVTSGRGWVETDGARVQLGPGDVVVAPAGEVHVHGAAPDSGFAHLNVTAGGFRLPDGAVPLSDR